MARGFLISTQTKNSSHFLLNSISETSRLTKLPYYPSSSSLRFSLSPPPSPPRFLCSCCSHFQENGTIDMSVHSEAFAKRMAMVGLKPHHRIGKFYPSIVFLFLFYFVDTKKEELKVRKRLQFYSIVVYSFLL